VSDSKQTTTIAVEAHRDSATRTSVDVRDFDLVVDEPEAMGGRNEGPNPLEYVLAGQAGCLNVTGQRVAEEMGLEIDGLELAVEGEFDQAAFAGERDGPTGLQDVAISMSVDADADEDTVDEWAERVEERCPVSETLQRETSIDLTLDRS
jgi:uncharacterized OsmC-like protein